jgi:hypothetical protein
VNNTLINKLAFNGFHVTVWDHEQRQITNLSYPDISDITSLGWNESFPDAAELAEGLFDVYGDCVGMITDNSGQVLYDNMEAMNNIHAEMSTY